MPQVGGAAIRARAARLRGAGAVRVRAHLDAQQGSVYRILMESARLGRTEQFAEVAFGDDQPVGTLVTARITGRHGARLLA